MTHTELFADYTARSMESDLARPELATKALRLTGQHSIVRPTTVFLIIPDNGSDGMGEPIAAFTTEARAEDAILLIKAANGSVHRVVAVEVKT